MKKRLLISVGIAVFLLIAQFGTVLAAQEGTPITGTVTSVTLEVDPDTNETSVVAVVSLDGGGTQTVRLSADIAEGLGLVNVDDVTGVVTVNEIPAEGIDVEINPDDVIQDGETEEEEDQHPVASALADFFGEMFDVDYEVIMNAHEDGVGFGVIAQALWMTDRLEGDSETFQEILEAKLNKDFEFTMPDGTTVEAENWGQFKKAIMDSHENLGTVMSDKDDDENAKENPGQQQKENKQKNKDKNKNKGKGKP